MEPLILKGRRWGSVGRFILTAPVGVLLVAAFLHLIPQAEYGKAALFAALASIMLFQGADAAMMAARPPRLILTAEGLALEAPFKSRRWSWDQYAGLHGWWARALIVTDQPGKKRWIPIGHWQPDLGRLIATYAGEAGQEVPAGSEFEVPSPLPLFVASGVLLLFALGVAAAWLR